MSQYAVRRALLIVPTLLIASLLIATLVRILPGDVIDNMVAGGVGGRTTQTEEVKEHTRAKLGLDAPFHVQYIRWMFGWPKTEGTVFKTSDGGATWKRSGVEVIKPFDQVSFLSPTLGWGLADNMIFSTDDGGRIWSRQFKGDDRINSLLMLDEKSGWAVGDKGVILHTSEGGERLESEEGVLTFSWVAQDGITTERLTDVAFVDEQTGWVVGEKGTIRHTSDGGVSWQAQSGNTEMNLSSVTFYDSRTGWAVGEKGTILRTSDGGRAWLPPISDATKNLNSISFADSLHLWAVGDDGTILQSSDGGFSWAPRTVDEGLKQNLSSVAFGDERNGMIAGDGGLILATTDGGATWLRKGIVPTRREGSEIVQEDPIRGSMKHMSLLVTGRGTVQAWVTTVDTHWRWGVVGGNLGESFEFKGSAVGGQLMKRLGPSIQLMIMSLIAVVAVSIPIGIFSAIRQDNWADYLGRIFAISGLAIPSFWLGSMLIRVWSFHLEELPVFGRLQLTYVSFFDDPTTNLWYYMLPALVAAFPSMAELMRMTRSMMLEVLRQDYVRTAWSKGLRERAVITSHALKNAMIPVVTMLGMLIPYQLGALVIIERIFNVPGVGRMLLDAIEARDFPVIQGVSLFLGVVVVATNLIVDLLYSWLDPRIRYS
ncbi:MAG: ABC transporter permease subunit [Dehalococcoidia bacterium]